MKIYTKTGDKGETSLIGGKRVPKYHIRIEAYGTVDELISFIGLIRDQAIDEITKNKLIQIQDRLMTCAAILATDCDDNFIKIPKLSEGDIEFLEKEIDGIALQVPSLDSFILPGGHPVVSLTHVARTICRRAERQTLRLSAEAQVPELIIKYLNRLSDYLFMLARKLSVDLQSVEITWKPKL
jgi:cob(I)alamin adenosyltransferase